MSIDIGALVFLTFSSTPYLVGVGAQLDAVQIINTPRITPGMTVTIDQNVPVTPSGDALSFAVVLVMIELVTASLFGHD